MKIHFRIPTKHQAYHYSQHLLHCTYLSAGAYKAPLSVYGIAAMGLVILVVVGLFIGEAE